MYPLVHNQEKNKTAAEDPQKKQANRLRSGT